MTASAPMFRPLGRLAPLAVLLLAGVLSACAGANLPPPTEAAPAASAAAAGAGPADSTGGAAGCAAAIASFEKVINSDVETGNLGRSVYPRIVADLAKPKATCAAGRDGEARSQLAAVRARYGFP